MKKEYDFSDAEQGRFYRPLKELDIHVRQVDLKQTEFAPNL